MAVAHRDVTYKTRKRRKDVAMTTGEYLGTPETLLPAELAYGVMRVADAPAVRHQRMVGDLFKALDAHVARYGLGEVLLAPTDVILDYDSALVVQPDLLFVSSERADIVADNVHGAPDLVVEVLSPHPRIGKLDERVGWFAKYGVRECWLADLRERRYSILSLGPRGVLNRQLCSGGGVAPSTVLPGVTLPEFSAGHSFPRRESLEG
ncbi:MAG: hypothetical protein A3H97_16380 [Acidobacteria bacterium RIFCSPLOWO2_02_FULL_65_29]|nr:MAG: hypothetical protein A3H97_16380 [Acidobacteria bacterium RIFCSPLOWO2_02_FULL_65_29]